MLCIVLFLDKHALICRDKGAGHSGTAHFASCEQTQELDLWAVSCLHDLFLVAHGKQNEILKGHHSSPDFSMFPLLGNVLRILLEDLFCNIKWHCSAEFICRRNESSCDMTKARVQGSAAWQGIITINLIHQLCT